MYECPKRVHKHSKAVCAGEQEKPEFKDMEGYPSKDLMHTYTCTLIRSFPNIEFLFSGGREREKIRERERATQKHAVKKREKRQKGKQR